MSCCKKCCIPPYFFLLSNLNNTGNIRGSFVAVLQELNAQQNPVNTITAQGQLVGSATTATVSLTSANVSITSSNGNSVGNFGLFLNGNTTGPTLGVTYSDFTSGFIDSHVATSSAINNIPGSTTLTGANVTFQRASATTPGTANYDYVITITIN
jgi:hypothetical protein